MEGKENKHHHHHQQQQEHQEEIKKHHKSKNKVLITIYQEPPQQPNRPSSSEPTNPNPTSTQGYDRRTLLIAYAQQLRQLGSAVAQDQAVAKKPEWGRWKAAFVEHHGMRRRDGQRFHLWIRRVVGRVMRRRPWPWEYEIVDDDRSTIEGSSCPCCDKKEWKKKLRRFLMRGKGMSGCC